MLTARGERKGGEGAQAQLLWAAICAGQAPRHRASARGTRGTFERCRFGACLVVANRLGCCGSPPRVARIAQLDVDVCCSEARNWCSSIYDMFLTRIYSLDGFDVPHRLLLRSPQAARAMPKATLTPDYRYIYSDGTV